jgi:hypothetical protein
MNKALAVLCLTFCGLIGTAFAHAAETTEAQSETQVELSIPLTLLEPKTHMQGTFTQERHISVLSMPLRSSGEFNFDKTNGLIWQTLSPINNTVKINRDQGVLAGSTAKGFTAVPSSQILAEIFLGVFSGDLASLEQLFAIEPLAVNSGWRIKLTPTVAAMKEYIEVIYLNGEQEINAINLHERNGDRSDIALAIESSH